MAALAAALGPLLLLLPPLACFEASWASKFATKTAYRNVRFPGPPFAVPAGCRLVAFDFLLRHGTRLPKADTVSAADRLRAAILRRVGPKAAILRGWRQPYRPDAAKTLAEVGRAEMAALARAAQRWMAPLACSAANCRLLTTDRQRTRQSAAAFQKHLGPKAPSAAIDDKLLRYYDDCPKHTVGGGAGARFEAFRRAAVGSKAAALKAKLGLPASERFSVGEEWAVRVDVLNKAFDRACVHSLGDTEGRVRRLLTAL